MTSNRLLVSAMSDVVGAARLAMSDWTWTFTHCPDGCDGLQPMLACSASAFGSTTEPRCRSQLARFEAKRSVTKRVGGRGGALLGCERCERNKEGAHMGVTREARHSSQNWQDFIRRKRAPQMNFVADFDTCMLISRVKMSASSRCELRRSMHAFATAFAT
jgi:hypothetical protein